MLINGDFVEGPEGWTGTVPAGICLWCRYPAERYGCHRTSRVETGPFDRVILWECLAP